MKNITYYNAGAGSGKTFKLTSLLVEKIQDKGNPVNPSEVILTTFTELAAAEFKEKAREALLEANLLDKAMELDSGAIGTVHSVAMNMIKKYWYLLGISPQVNVMSDTDKKFYISQSILSIVRPEQLAFFNDYYRNFKLENLDFWLYDVEDIVNAIANYQIDDTGLADSLSESQKRVDTIFNNTVIPDKTKIEQICDNMITICERPDFANQYNAKTALKTLKGINRNALLAYDTILTLYKVAMPGGKKVAEELKTQLGFDYKEYLKDCLTSTYYGKIIKECIKHIFDIAKKWVDEFQKYKKENAIIDYNDMEQLFLKLLDMDTFRDEIRQRYKVVMVDEFQDSNPTQLRIFDKLSELVKESIWVGDPKQAIYGFRGADTDLIQTISNEIVKDKRDRNLKHDNLPESWRTRPELVHLANNVFLRSLAGMLLPDMITLAPHWSVNKALGYPLLHWHCEGNKEASYKIIANKIKELLHSGISVGIKNKNPETRKIEPKDIALLTFSNDECKAYIDALRKLGVPVSSPENDILGRTEVQLVCSILNYILYPYNRHTTSCLRRLWNDVSVETILQEDLDQVAAIAATKSDDSDKAMETVSEKDVPAELMQIHNVAERLKGQPISDMVASIITELNLAEVVKKWGEGPIRIQNLYTFEKIAKQYDEHCLQLGLGATIGGFLQYLKSIEMESPADNTSNTVKVLTYHKSKGLEWPVVILTSLEKNSLDTQSLVQKQYMSISCYPLNEKDSLDKRIYRIHYFPVIYSAKDVADVVVESIQKEPFFLPLHNKVKDELKRLLYVGFTRARDYLVTTSHTSYNKLVPLTWLCNAGISTNGKFPVDGSDINVWNDNRNEKEKPPLLAKCTLAALPALALSTPPKYTPKDFPEYKPEVRYPKFLRPSSLPLEGTLANKPEICYNSGLRIDLSKTNEENMADIGTCIHNALASFVVGEDENNKLKARRIVSDGNFVDNVVVPEQIVTAFNNLLDFIKSKKDVYGELQGIAQEVPFYHRLKGGQIVQGEMDLVCKMEKGLVLIDYKSFPGKITDFTDEGGKHFVGNYAPQLAAYRNALEAAGETVLDNLIYYVVQGCVVRL